jgi:hypothetical protein
LKDEYNPYIENRGIDENEKIQVGDLIFQTSKSGQSQAIPLATKSKYSHCGIIYQGENGFMCLKRLVRSSVHPLKTGFEEAYKAIM